MATAQQEAQRLRMDELSLKDPAPGRGGDAKSSSGKPVQSTAALMVGARHANVAESPEGFRVHTWGGGNDRLSFGIASAQGRRPEMEDAHAVNLNLGDPGATSLFGVFDGHAGREVAAYAARHVGEVIVRQPAFAASLTDGLEAAFQQLEHDMMQPAARHELFCLRHGLSLSSLERHPSTADAADGYGVQDPADGAYIGPQAGATAVVALLRGEQLCVASVGDSRCVLSDGGRAVCLTRDHKAANPSEARRVIKAGLSIVSGRVSMGGCSSGGCSLAMTRALGDTRYKQQPGLPAEDQAVTPVPDTTCAQVDLLAGAPAGDARGVAELGLADFMLLACDGLFDVLSNQQAITFIHVAMAKGLSSQQAAQALVEEALSAHSVTPPTHDNVTVVVVQYAGPASS